MPTISGRFSEPGTTARVVVTNYRRSGDPRQPASVTTDTYANTEHISGSWSRTTNVTPGFGRGVGRLKPLPYFYTHSKSTGADGYKVSTPRPGNYTGTFSNETGTGMSGGGVPADVANDLGVDSDVLSRLDAECRTALLSKLKAGTVNIGVATAESKKTSQTVFNAATRIYKSYRSLRRGNFAQAAEDLGGVASRRGRKRFSRQYAKDVEQAVAKGWLELQYGWKPLLNDVYGAADAAARQQMVPMYLRQSTTKRFRQELRGFRTATDSGTKRSYYDDGFRETVVRYGVTYIRQPGAARNAAEMGLTNPLLVAWELVPFSFVADWFLPVGKALETLDATNGLSFVDGYVSTVVRRNISYTNVTENKSSSVWIDNNLGTRKEFVRFERKVLSAFPSPARPRFRQPFTTLRALSAIALISTIFRK